MNKLLCWMLLLLALSFAWGCQRNKQASKKKDEVTTTDTTTSITDGEKWTYRSTIHPELPEFAFKLVGEVSDMSEDIVNVNAIDIRKSNESQPFQTIQGLDTETPVREDYVGFEIEDMNFDGYRDIRIVELLPAGPNIPYLYWLFEPKAGSFVQNKELEEITSPEFESDKKRIKSSWRDSAVRYGTDYYQFTGGKPLLVRQEIEEYSNEGVKRLTVRERVGDEMKVVEQK